MKLLFTLILFSMLINAQSSKWYDDISLNGFVSSSYSNNFNNPATGKNQFRVFDFDNNSFKLDVAELVFQKPVSDPGNAGFRIDLTTGSSVPYLVNSNGNPHEIDFQQVYLSYIAKLGNGLRFDAGKFITPLGYELIEGYDGYNDNSTRSFLFGYAIPFTHTGLKMSYPFSKSFTAMVMLVNGWDNSVDNNKSKTFGLQLIYNPTETVFLNANFIGGPEQLNNNSRNRFVYDFCGIVKLNSSISVGVNVDYGVEQKSNAIGEDAKWYGAAGYFRFNMCECFSLALRGESFNDQDGIRTGIQQTLSEVTITPEYRFNSNFILRGDLRLDKSNNLVFDKEGKFKDSQLIALVNLIFVL